MVVLFRLPARQLCKRKTLLCMNSCDRVSVKEITFHPAFVYIGLIECIQYVPLKNRRCIAGIVKSIEFDCFNSVVGMLPKGYG